MARSRVGCRVGQQVVFLIYVDLDGGWGLHLGEGVDWVFSICLLGIGVICWRESVTCVHFISDYAWAGILDLVWVNIVICGSLSGVVGQVGPSVVVGAFEGVSEFIRLVWVVVLGPAVLYMFGWSVCHTGFEVVFMGWVYRTGWVIRVVEWIITGFVVGTSRHGGAVSCSALVCVTCHTRHASVTYFRPILGNIVEVTLMTPPTIVHKFPH